MKPTSITLLACLLAHPCALWANEDPPLPAKPVVLDPVAVQNLRLATAPVTVQVFEETAFALGRIEALPEARAALSSRIAGRLVALKAFPGQQVARGEELARVESRQVGGTVPVVGLESPIEGWITQLDVRLGDPVEPDRALLEVTDLRQVLAIARVPEVVAGRMQPGTPARIRLAAVPGKVFEGRLLRFATQADAASGTLDAVFQLPNSEAILRPGMRAEFSLVLARREGVVAVPRAALQGDAARRFVYVRDSASEHAYRKVPVVVGQLNDGWAEILHGVDATQQVVTQGAYSLSFVGEGAISLKEALDAAHGHAHAADGSELDGHAAATDDHDHDHADEHPHGHETRWKVISGVLFVLLLLSLYRRRRQNPVAPTSDETRDST